MVLACSQFLAHAANADYFSKSGNFSSHCKVARNWLVDGARDKSREQRGACRRSILGSSTHRHMQMVVVFMKVTHLASFVQKIKHCNLHYFYTLRKSLAKTASLSE